MKITVSRDFDGFLLTGLYTSATSSPSNAANKLPGQGIGSNEPFGHNFICSVVHSHVSHRPQQQMKFTWRAPNKDSGCVNFM